MSFYPLIFASHTIMGDFRKRILDFPVSQALFPALFLVKPGQNVIILRDKLYRRIIPPENNA